MKNTIKIGLVLFGLLCTSIEVKAVTTKSNTSSLQQDNSLVTSWQKLKEKIVKKRRQKKEKDYAQMAKKGLILSIVSYPILGLIFLLPSVAFLFSIGQLLLIVLALTLAIIGLIWSAKAYKNLESKKEKQKMAFWGIILGLLFTGGIIGGLIVAPILLF